LKLITTGMFVAAKNRITVFSHKVNEYLKRVIQKPNVVEENVITPYGYDVDYVVHINTPEEGVLHPSQHCKKWVVDIPFNFNFLNDELFVG
jgi:hypothetical protein